MARLDELLQREPGNPVLQRLAGQRGALADALAGAPPAAAPQTVRKPGPITVTELGAPTDNPRQAIEQAQAAGIPHEQAVEAATQAKAGPGEGGFWSRFASAITTGRTIGNVYESDQEQAGVELFQEAMQRTGNPQAAFVEFMRNPKFPEYSEALPAIAQIMSTSAVRPPEATPPALQKFRQGDQEVAQRYNPATGAFETVGTGAAFAPPRPGTSVDIRNIMPAPMQANIWTDRGMERVAELDTDLGGAQRVMLNLDAAESAIKGGAHTEVVGPRVGFTTPLGHFGIDLGTEFMTSLLQVGAALGVVDRERMSQTELLQSVTATLAPLMRPVGSGSTSDKDMELYMQAVPSLAKSREGNLLIIALMRKGVLHKQQQMALLEAMLEDGTYTPSKFSRAVGELGRPFSDDEIETLEIVSQGKPQQAAKPARAANPSKLTAADIDKMQPREILLLDISKLSPEQRQAVANRMSQLGM